MCTRCAPASAAAGTGSQGSGRALHRPAAVDHEVDADDPGCLVGGEEHRGADGNSSWPTRPSGMQPHVRRPPTARRFLRPSRHIRQARSTRTSRYSSGSRTVARSIERSCRVREDKDKCSLHHRYPAEDGDHERQAGGPRVVGNHDHRTDQRNQQQCRKHPAIVADRVEKTCH